MSNEMEKYRAHIRSLGLSQQQENEMIGALLCIVESLLDKKYMLRSIHHEKTTA